MKYAVVTFGCRVNQADSLRVEEELIAAGAEPTTSERADVVIVNTCSVTASADQGARQTVRRIARDNPGARIVVTGCYATRAAGEIAALPQVAQIVPNQDKPQLVRWAVREGSGGAGTTEIGDGPCGTVLEPGVAGRTAFTLRVQTGCDEPCTYCIIPSTRGRSQSVPPAVLLHEIDRALASGFKEIALTGVHLGSFGRDLEPRASLPDLLRALPSDRGVLFRISSLEPMDCSPEIVDLVAASRHLAPHFHLPLQHGSNRVLTAMRRPYTVEYYAALVERIRRWIPHASIGSDIIVGFPGERDDDFERLVSYLNTSPLTHVHVFPYSDRPGTAATAMPGKVHGSIIRERARRIREIGSRLSAAFRAAQIGSVHRALTIEDGSLVVTGNYQKLRIPPGHRRNEWVTVRVEANERAVVLPGGAEGECGELLAG